MKSKWFIMLTTCWLLATLTTQAQTNEMPAPDPEPEMISKVKGYHIGIVQPIISINNGEVTQLLSYDNYSIGFPIGISLATPSKLIIDLEVVPFIAPLIEKRQNYEVHLLYHPGVLFPLKSGFTMGLRAAFEAGTGQFGYTFLINKSFNLSTNTKYFIEVVAPGRWGPNEKSGYTQVLAFHTGVAF